MKNSSQPVAASSAAVAASSSATAERKQFEYSASTTLEINSEGCLKLYEFYKILKNKRSEVDNKVRTKRGMSITEETNLKTRRSNFDEKIQKTKLRIIRFADKGTIAIAESEFKKIEETIKREIEHDLSRVSKEDYDIMFKQQFNQEKHSFITEFVFDKIEEELIKYQKSQTSSRERASSTASGGRNLITRVKSGSSNPHRYFADQKTLRTHIKANSSPAKIAASNPDLIDDNVTDYDIHREEVRSNEENIPNTVVESHSVDSVADKDQSKGGGCGGCVVS